MKNKIIDNAKKDYTKYRNDFNKFSDETFKNYNDDCLFECYVRTLFFKNWKQGFNSIKLDSLDQILSELHHDINSSYYLASIGLYRTANMHIRSMIELALQGIYFFEHPVEYSLWSSGDFVIKFDNLSKYIQNHPKFAENNIKAKINNLIGQIFEKWKLFSKHIHAESLNYFQTQKQSGINNSFILTDFNIWKSNYIKTIDMINKLYLLFFNNEFKIFPSNNRELLSLKV